MATNEQMFVFTPHPSDAEMRTYSNCIDYMNLGNRWTAKYYDGKFWHYRNGNPQQGHTDSYLDFDTAEGLMRLELRNGVMYVGKASDKGRNMSKSSMTYRGWDGKTWTADPIRAIAFHSDLP